MKRDAYQSEDDRRAAKLAAMNGWTPKPERKRLRAASHTMFLREMALRLYGSTKSEKFAREAIFEYMKLVFHALVEGKPVRLPLVGTLVPRIRRNRLHGNLKGAKGDEFRAEISFRASRSVRFARKENERTEAAIRAYNKPDLSPLEAVRRYGLAGITARNLER